MKNWKFLVHCLAHISAIMKNKKENHHDTYFKFVLIWNPLLALQILWCKWGSKYPTCRASDWLCSWLLQLESCVVRREPGCDLLEVTCFWPQWVLRCHTPQCHHLVGPLSCTQSLHTHGALCHFSQYPPTSSLFLYSEYNIFFDSFISYSFGNKLKYNVT